MNQAACVERVLSVLQGLEFWGSGRVSDLQWLQFGSRHDVPLRSGKAGQVGDYALHIQCAWHLRDQSEIIVASRDRYYPRGNPDLIDDKFNWDTPGGNRCDERMDQFLASHGSLPVETIAADEIGGFALTLKGGVVFRVFPDDSLRGELWRLLRPSIQSPHTVFEGGRIVEQTAV